MEGSQGIYGCADGLGLGLRSWSRTVWTYGRNHMLEFKVYGLRFRITRTWDSEFCIYWVAVEERKVIC